MTHPRVFSGMRPTGRLHIGHYFGVLANWVELQRNHECWYCIVDWHALTTHYAESAGVAEHAIEVCTDWLAAGIDPEKSTLFLQSQVPQHAELHLALSMLTPLGWLERIPSYKEQLAKLRHLDLTTYGFLGYPLLQTADILLYKATLVPVGADQVSHIELAREIARRFNSMYGKGQTFIDAVDDLYQTMSNKQRQKFESAVSAHNQHGNSAPGDAWLAEMQSELDETQLVVAAQLVRQKGHAILPEPSATLLPETAKIPGLDGRKMSKSYHNSIMLRDDPDRVSASIKTMPTDPARVRLKDPGSPEKCPVWQLHLIYSDKTTQKEIHQACTSAAIGCVACKQRVCEPIISANNSFIERAGQYNDKAQILSLLKRGAESARDTAADTMREVKTAMRLVDG